MGTTPIHGLPYPENTDLVTNGAAAMQALAEGVDAKLGTGGGRLVAAVAPMDDHPGGGQVPATGAPLVPAGTYFVQVSARVAKDATAGSVIFGLAPSVGESGIYTFDANEQKTLSHGYVLTVAGDTEVRIDCSAAGGTLDVRSLSIAIWDMP